MENQELLEALLSSVDFKKYITGLIFIFTIPAILNVIVVIFKNKNLSKLMEAIDKSNEMNALHIKSIREEVRDLYLSKFIEGTPQQLSFAFRARVYFDIEAITKDVNKLILMNGFANKAATRVKIRTIITNVQNRTKTEFNCFERNNVPVSMFFRDSWIDGNAAIVEDFIYNSKITQNDKYSYNFDILKSKLKTNFDTITYEFDNLINP